LTRVGLSSDIRHSADAARRQRSVHQQLTHAIRDEFARWAPRLGPPAGATSLARAVVYPIAETMTSARLSGFSLSLLVLGGCNALEVANPGRPTPLIAPAAAPETPKTQYPSNGTDLVAFVAGRFPDRLAAGVSYDDRVANMEFLRDQVIAAGICGGMDLARNLKRGKGPHSIDAIAWRHEDGWVDVVDIASAYDDTRRDLRLHWLVVAGPPGWDPIPAPECP
jgi:hypothetical protein